MSITYDVSLYPTKKWIAVNYRKKKLIRIYLSKLTEHIKKHYDDRIYNYWLHYDNGFAEYLLEGIIRLTLIERVCLEDQLQKSRIKNKCKGYKGCSCKIEYIVDIIQKFLK